MADPTKILTYAKQRRDNAALAVVAAQQQLTKAQAAIAASNNEIAKATGELAELEKRAADIRKKLSEIITAADGAALLDELEQIIIRVRAERANILRAQGELLAAQSDATLAGTGLAASTALLTSAEADFKKAEQSDKQREALKKSLTTLPLSKLNTDADTALKNKPFTDAQARIAADIPARLLARAEERRDAEAKRISRRSDETKAAEVAVAAERDKNGGLTGPANNALAAFLRLDAAAKNLVSAGKSSFDQAQATLAQVGDPTRSPLTAEQKARITDATLKADRETAAADEKALAAKLKDWEDKQAALDAEILKAKAAGKDPEEEKKVKDARKEVETAANTFKTADDAWRKPEKGRDDALDKVAAQQVVLSQAIKKAIAAKKNPDTDPDVIKAKSDLAKAQSDFKKAEDDYQASGHGILDAWEAAVPDTAWRLFDDYKEAEATLILLKGTDPAQLKTELQKAEEEYIKAQLIADKGANVLAQLAAEQAQRAAREQTARQIGAARLFSALRGDN